MSDEERRAGLSDAKYEETRDRVYQFLELWKHRMYLNEWNIRPWFETDQSSFQSEPEGPHSIISETQMEVSGDWSRRRAAVVVNAIWAANADDGELEVAVIHELCHLVIYCTRAPEFLGLEKWQGDVIEELHEFAAATLERTVLSVWYVGRGEWDDAEQGGQGEEAGDQGAE